jgi:type I restriction enzyme M protein
VLGKDNVRQGFYGQEVNLTTYNLARINMFLHDVNYEKFSLAHGDTLIDPQHWDDEPFEAIVSNPPYSIRWEGDANPLLINDPRFAPAGVLAPKSKADLAFTMHILSWLAVNGTAAIVEFPGVLYRGGTEDPPVPGRQQLRGCGDPASAGSLFRHDHRHLHHRAQEVQI